MATAVLRSHDPLANRMHLDAFAASPQAAKQRRRRHPKPASPPPKVVAGSSPPKPALLASPALKQAPAAGRRSPPAKPARKQPSPTKEKPRQQPIVMEAVRILKRGEEPPAPSPSPASPPVVKARPQAPPADRRVRSPPPASAPIASARAQAPPADKRALRTTSRIGPQQPAVVPTKKMVPVAIATSYAGPAFSAAAPEPSSLPLPGFFFRRAEEEATRGLRCLLRIGELS
ncbi:vegetative cell wall protein gp1-like isoform X3 [Triticum dicoccoides]|uniref:vegetative cell wall protein gp1-like isoform X2 n=1 Tax=Triticum dicoccoides TaxID=85692 RepID=UPI001891C1F8|nr:vegetative cell wall protein gp1-like isoform X2 [Triticum dicoccoides]XP_037448769.1 vegetative cell wall protein gp1-like isoform X3 [Triticum dicoccoides]